MSSLLKLQHIVFPSPRGIAVNMMPFIMGEHASLPREVRSYISLIEACSVEQEQVGTVCYLSVQESAVSTERPSQRRPGIHTEKHPTADWGGGGWGHGSLTDKRSGGIYTASTVSGACRAWNSHIDKTGPMGDCEHLRAELESSGPGVRMDRDTLYWMTDSCPHESLPLAPGTFRQWFRLVTNAVSLWYAKHSTANPLGVLPNCPIILEDKFHAV